MAQSWPSNLQNKVMLLPVMASVMYNVDKNSGRDSSPFSGSSKPWKSGPLIITHFHPPSSPFTLLSQEPQLRESRSVTIWNQPIRKAKHSVWQWEDLIKPAVDGCVHRAVRKPLSSHRPTSNCGFTTLSMWLSYTPKPIRTNCLGSVTILHLSLI